MIPVVLALLFCHALGQLTLPAHFNWSDCGPSDRKIRIACLHIDPFPVKLPGIITVSLEGTVSGTLPADFTMDVNIKKWTLGQWGNMPCIHNVGSCHYDYPFELLKTFTRFGYYHQLVENGLPYSCAIAPERIYMIREIFNVSHIPDTYSRFVETFGSPRYSVVCSNHFDSSDCLVSYVLHSLYF
ncbi:hypothetical protein ACJMK2_029242 [Sinanodonta woodiana]|uniref:MD-2-related lipid-recognition domain-containing protein n=1 Tax=Sinanodonta woodiana TaxID=1069815 RepID=A0ABD3XDF2_SINWO